MRRRRPDGASADSGLPAGRGCFPLFRLRAGPDRTGLQELVAGRPKPWQSCGARTSAGLDSGSCRPHSGPGGDPTGDRPHPSAARPRVPGICRLRSRHAGLALPAPGLRLGADRLPGFSAFPGRIRHRAEGDVHLCVSLRPVRHDAGGDRRDGLRAGCRAPVFREAYRGPCEGCRRRFRDHGIAFRQRGRQHGHNGYVHDPDDAFGRIPVRDGGGDRGGGQLGRGAGAADHGRWRIYDAGDGGAGGHLSGDRKSGAHPCGILLYRASADRPLPRPAHPGCLRG